MKVAATCLITILALTCSGCAPQILTDTKISIRVKNGLATDNETSAVQIGVETVDRVVTLSGTVPTEREKAKAERIARHSEGVRDVVNNITVNPKATGKTNAERKAEKAASDVTILAKVRAKLITEGITGTDIDVSNGLVTLRGEVPNAEKSAQATDIARSTSGVRSVDNRLIVKRQ